MVGCGCCCDGGRGVTVATMAMVDIFGELKQGNYIGGSLAGYKKDTVSFLRALGANFSNLEIFCKNGYHKCANAHLCVCRLKSQ